MYKNYWEMKYLLEKNILKILRRIYVIINFIIYNIQKIKYEKN